MHSNTNVHKAKIIIVILSFQYFRQLVCNSANAKIFALNLDNKKTIK